MNVSRQRLVGLNYCLYFLAIFSYAIGQPNSFSLEVDNSEIDRSVSNPVQSYSSILDKSTPAVVAVTTQQLVRRLYPGEETLRRIG